MSLFVRARVVLCDHWIVFALNCVMRQIYGWCEFQHHQTDIGCSSRLIGRDLARVTVSTVIDFNQRIHPIILTHIISKTGFFVLRFAVFAVVILFSIQVLSTAMDASACTYCAVGCCSLAREHCTHITLTPMLLMFAFRVPKKKTKTHTKRQHRNRRM